jgi:transcription-repair coupling factor (superfamily II helicase)
MINRADRFGLAQLHQLRGRVGRSHHRAYAYLLAPPLKALAGDAAKRLEAIESMEDLGAGFVLATHDLEIRGAGELLGEQQSGQMTEIGLAMYLDMLEQAVKALKQGQKPNLDKPLAAETEVELRLPAFLPEAYVADVHVRLGLYKRIAAAEALDELNAELYDRFGPLPPSAKNLLELAKLKLAARALGIRRMDLGAGGGTILFEERNNIDPLTVIQMIQTHPLEFKLEGSLKLRIAHLLGSETERFEFAGALMKRLAEKPKPQASKPVPVKPASKTPATPPKRR